MFNPISVHYIYGQYISHLPFSRYQLQYWLLKNPICLPIIKRMNIKEWWQKRRFIIESEKIMRKKMAQGNLSNKASAYEVNLFRFGSSILLKQSDFIYAGCIRLENYSVWEKEKLPSSSSSSRGAHESTHKVRRPHYMKYSHCTLKCRSPALALGRPAVLLSFIYFFIW